MILNFMDKKGICTIIQADCRTETVKIENKTDFILHRAFGINETPTWNDFQEFLRERCCPETRDKLKKGNQLKWHDHGTWYRADYLGYEALSEYVVSQLLKKSNVPSFADYSIVSVEFQGEKIYGLLEKNRYMVDGVSEITGLKDFGKYITMLLEVDAIFLNEDRHTNNIAVILKADGTFSYSPVFDNGAGLFSDITINFEMELPLDQCYEIIEAKPFDRDFDVQMDAAEELYGTQFQYWFTGKDVENLHEHMSLFYPEKVVNRVVEIMRRQIHKYQYLSKK